MIAVGFFVYGTAFQCARSRLNRKWLWVFVSLLGVFRVNLHWQSGILFTEWLTISALGISVEPTVAGVVVGFSLPAGALIAQERLRHAKSEPSAIESQIGGS